VIKVHQYLYEEIPPGQERLGCSANAPASGISDSFPAEREIERRLKKSLSFSGCVCYSLLPVGGGNELEWAWCLVM